LRKDPIGWTNVKFASWKGPAAALDETLIEA